MVTIPTLLQLYHPRYYLKTRRCSKLVEIFHLPETKLNNELKKQSFYSFIYRVKYLNNMRLRWFAVVVSSEYKFVYFLTLFLNKPDSKIKSAIFWYFLFGKP